MCQIPEIKHTNRNSIPFLDLELDHQFDAFTDMCLELFVLLIHRHKLPLVGYGAPILVDCTTHALLHDCLHVERQTTDRVDPHGLLGPEELVGLFLCVVNE